MKFVRVIYILLFSISLILAYQYLKDKDFSEVVNKLSRYSNASKTQKKEIIESLNKKDKKTLIQNYKKNEKLKKLENKKLIESLNNLPLDKEINCYSNENKIHPACKPFINTGSKVKKLAKNNSQAMKDLIISLNKKLSYQEQKKLIEKIKVIKKEKENTDFSEAISLSLINNNKYLLDVLFKSGYQKKDEYMILAYRTSSIYVLSKVIQAGISPEVKNKKGENIFYLSCKDNNKKIFTFLLTESNNYTKNNNYNKIENCLNKNGWKNDDKILKLLSKKDIPSKVKYFSGKKIIDPEKLKKDQDQIKEYNKQIELYNLKKEEKRKEHKDKVIRELNDIIDM